MNLPAIRKFDFGTHAGGRSSGHAHATGILLTSGAAEFALSRRFTLRPGELYVIPAGADHSCFGARESHTVGWGFHLPAGFNRVPARKPVARLSERSRLDLESWLDRIQSESERRDPCSLALGEALYRAVQIECARAMSVADCAASSSRVVEGALRIIRADYAKPLRPRDIAARIGVSASHLSHELQRHTGRSPSEWILQARVEAAKGLLLTSGATVSHVAESIGYADVSQLNRSFRRLTGLSPKAWRRANQARISAD